MASPPAIPLKWSTQLNAAPLAQTHKLPGDKITLPPSALEQLLAAATVTIVAEEDDPHPFNPFDPLNFTSAARSTVVERHQNLPHPLTFRLVNPINGHVVYAGIREFSAQEEELGLSDFLRAALGITDSGTPARITIHAQQLAKGTHIRFRPLEAGYDPDDWKALLERQLRHNFTTLTKGEVVTIPSGHEEYRFLVDDVQPEGDAICIVDTDLEVDIEPLNEEQAKETLKQRLAKTARPRHNGTESSPGGPLVIGHGVDGIVVAGEYVDFELNQWDRSRYFLVELESDGPLELYVSSFSSLQRQRPRETQHELHDLSDRRVRSVSLRELADSYPVAEAIYISIYNPAAWQLGFSLSVIDEEAEASIGETHEVSDVRCKNCHQWVPQQSLFLHENFCYRNNIVCPDCQEVFKKQSEEWTEHWHCEHDISHGNSVASKSRHDEFYHQPTLCKACGYHCRSLANLAHHQTSTCPEKAILCQFCHLIVPQQGPEDLDVNDAEVLVSGLTPHELSDGATTSECHICSRLVRLRDMATHLRHHDLDRLRQSRPRLCRNINCGRTLEGIDSQGKIKASQPLLNDVGLCDSCFGPLYNSAFDPNHKALQRRVERRYMTQLLTGCGKKWCHNHYCKTGRQNTTALDISPKKEMALLRPMIENLMVLELPLYFCVDEHSQSRRLMANMVAEEDIGGSKENGYELPWCVAALEAASGNLDRARQWLENHASRRREESLS